MIACRVCGGDAYEGVAPPRLGPRRKYCPPCKKSVDATYHAAYHASPEGKATRAAYISSPEGKLSVENAQAVYRASAGSKKLRAGWSVRNWAKRLSSAARRVTRGTRKARGLVCEITQEWIVEQFDRQGGKCFYTSIPMVPSADPRNPFQPSLERRDSAVGYLASEEQTVLVCLAANYAKGTSTESTFREWLAAVRAASPHLS